MLHLGPAIAQSNVKIQDHYKNVIMQLPKRVEVCYDQSVSGDKTGDALMGAIIGGIIGNNVTEAPDGGTVGAIIGGMLGHQNSDAKGGIYIKYVGRDSIYRIHKNESIHIQPYRFYITVRYTK